AGYAVLAYDQCGFGDRLLEGADFYTRHPHWSKLGRMVFDVRSALDFIHGGPGRVAGEPPALDSKRVILLGYSLGGMVALHAAALDERVTAVASFCGFTPMRS
ncbi:MAG: alpha/beta hydrolase, partial [Akkermansiaceae bacterium]|nr:alpha/beta hydrolase [Akkermansiaceae bacterium]